MAPKAGERFVVKVQRPLKVEPPELGEAILLYNRDQSVRYLEREPAAVAKIKEAMGPLVLCFMWAELDAAGTLVVTGPAPVQEW